MGVWDENQLEKLTTNPATGKVIRPGLSAGVWRDFKEVSRISINDCWERLNGYLENVSTAFNEKCKVQKT